jgi:hypothetical protein
MPVTCEYAFATVRRCSPRSAGVDGKVTAKLVVLSYEILWFWFDLRDKRLEIALSTRGVSPKYGARQGSTVAMSTQSGPGATPCELAQGTPAGVGIAVAS